MTLEELKLSISDLTGVEPRSIGTDQQAKEAATWIELQKRAEADTETILGPAIKDAFAAHKKLTLQKKSILEKLLAAKDRVRAGLAKWIAADHSVEGCYIKTKFKVTVTSLVELPSEYLMTVPNTEELEKWAQLTEGKQPLPGCTIEPVHVLYAKETA